MFIFQFVCFFSRPPRWPSGTSYASRPRDLGSIPSFAVDLFHVESCHRLQNWCSSVYPAWCYRVRAGTGSPGVSILWLDEREGLVCNFCPSVAARTFVWADPSMRYTSVLLRLSAINHSTNQPVFFVLKGRVQWQGQQQQQHPSAAQNPFISVSKRARKRAQGRQAVCPELSDNRTVKRFSSV